jgi:Fe-S oxidoreductase
MLLDDPDAVTVASQVIEAGAFLAQLADDGELRTDLAPLPLRVGYHTPCHLKALKRGLPLRKLLDLIPQLDVVTIEKGCSGMAGAFGLTRDNFDLSVEIGRPLMERIAEPDLMIGATECSSCRIQMEQNTDKPTVHPIKLLAASYGLLPGLRESLLWERARAESQS